MFSNEEELKGTFIKHGLDWTGLVKHGVIKHGLIKCGFIKQWINKRELIKDGLRNY